ncbi:MAG: metal ABC transporter ATP-binding protein [Eubacteriaceae bacterium]|nr:metal ABC transporter ATP-binding protein [Eubacteriaceae bacterium]
MDIIKLNGVFVRYNTDWVLENIDLTIKEKEFLSIIGPNGGGKTTLIRTIMGLNEPEIGELWVKEGLRIGYVPQFTRFDRSFPINVYDTIISGRLSSQIKAFSRFSTSDRRLADETITRMNLGRLKFKQIGRLSGGQLQKVLIARALVAEPDVLLLDEPTANLDAENKEEIYSILQEYNQEKTIVLITHDLEYVNDKKREIMVLNKKVIYRGETPQKHELACINGDMSGMINRSAEKDGGNDV